MTLVVPGDRDHERAVGDTGRIVFVKAPPAPAFDRRYRILLPYRYLAPVTTRIGRVLRRDPRRTWACSSS